MPHLLDAGAIHLGKLDLIRKILSCHVAKTNPSKKNRTLSNPALIALVLTSLSGAAVVVPEKHPYWAAFNKTIQLILVLSFPLILPQLENIFTPLNIFAPFSLACFLDWLT